MSLETPDRDAKALDTWDVAYRVVASGAVALLLAILVAASRREYTDSGAVAVFCVLLLFSATLLLSSRYIATTSVVIVSILAMFDSFDHLKFEATKFHLQYHDVLIIGEYLSALDWGFFQQYWEPVRGMLLNLAALSAAVIGIFLLERRSRPLFSRSWPLAALTATVTCAAAVVLFSSSYFTAVASQSFFRVARDWSPLRVSTSVLAAAASIDLAARLKSDAYRYPAPHFPSAAPCPTCPDFIVVHLESTFDPRFEHAYAAMPELQTFIGAGLDKSSALMEVHTWGGSSWITEFELMCSLRHELFGWAGLQTHLAVAPYLKGCLGTELKSLGYQTAALYTFQRSFIGVGPAFANYGVDTFLDSQDLALPTSWHEMRDGLMYDHLTRLLKEPRTGPRFFWLSTNWNHGPHDADHLREKFPGPYDSSVAGRPDLADYVNRLNDSLTALEKLTAFVRDAGWPIALLVYGDHHPNFKKHYDNATVAGLRQTGRDPDLLTPVLLLRNYRSEGQGFDRPVVNVEDVAAYATHYFGIGPTPHLDFLRSLAQGCPHGRQPACSDADKRRLRAFYAQ